MIRLIHMNSSSTLWKFVAFTRMPPVIPSQRDDLPCVAPSRGAISVRDVKSGNRDD